MNTIVNPLIKTTQIVLLQICFCAILNAQNVFPGDANNDHLVDKNDVLNIGLYHGETGVPRMNASLIWQAQAAILWNNVAPGTSADAAYADCDGNGIVDTADLAAIRQNYRLFHNRPAAPANTIAMRTNDVEVFVIFDDDTLNVDETSGNPCNFEAEIWVGSAAQPANDVYGVAFSVYYDPNFMDAAEPLEVVYNSNWFGEDYEIALFSNDARPSGRLDIGLTRLTQTNVTGFGRVAKIKGGVIGENINGRPQKSLRQQFFQMNVGNHSTRICAANGSILASTHGAPDSVLVRVNALTPTQNAAAQTPVLRILPNKISVGQRFLVEGISEDFNYSISDAFGRIIEEGNRSVHQNQFFLDKNLVGGVYNLTISSPKGVRTQRFWVY